MANWYTVIIYILIGIAIFSLLSFLMSIFPFKFRTAGNPSDYGLQYEDIRFKTADRLSLAGWLIPGKKGAPTIIVGHGYPFDKANILPIVTFLHPEYNLFLFDFRSFGQSEGSLTTAGVKEQEDVHAAIKYLKKRKDVSHTFGAYGFSLSAATFLMAEHPDIKVIVADSPYASGHEIIKELYRYLGPLKFPFVWTTEVYARLFLGMNPKQHVARVTVPTLLIHGSADSQISVKNSEMIYATNPALAELWIVPGADHGFSYATNPKKYKAKVKGFFDKHLK